MTVEEKNIEVKEKFDIILKDVKGKINNEFLSNPKFEELFLGELNYIYFKTASLEIDIDVALDKNYVSIISNAPLINCSKKEFDGNNKNYFKTTFYMKNGNLFIDYDQGTLINREVLESANLESSFAYESKLETNYSMRCFTKGGVEYSNNSYSDIYFLDTNCESTNIKEVVSSSFHKPTFSEYKLAKVPIHSLNASIRNTYRKKGEFGVIHTNHAIFTKNKYENVICSLYTVHPMFPELLRGETKIAKSVENDGKYIFVVENDYSENVTEGIKKANVEFKKKLEEEKEKINKNIYEDILENINN